MVCSQCESALNNDQVRQNLPKFTIANIFSIGKLPQKLTGLLTDATSLLLSPVRPFVHVTQWRSTQNTWSFFCFSIKILKRILEHSFFMPTPLVT
jgi:hypothetical protein